MSIRLVNGCVNCQNLEGNTCAVHNTTVAAKHTCDSFDMRKSLLNEVDCTSCAKFNTPECPHQANATAGMLCNAYAPEAMA